MSLMAELMEFLVSQADAISADGGEQGVEVYPEFSAVHGPGHTTVIILGSDPECSYSKVMRE